jgi:hypothetical protein
MDQWTELGQGPEVPRVGRGLPSRVRLRHFLMMASPPPETEIGYVTHNARYTSESPEC